jgi:hypothetical protein
MPGKPRIYTSRRFDRFVIGHGITDEMLIEAAREIEADPRQGNLGGNVIKKRIGRSDGGKSGGFRTVVLFKLETRAIFAYGFPKNAKSTLTKKEERAFKALAKELLGLSEERMRAVVEAGGFREIERGEDDET